MKEFIDNYIEKEIEKNEKSEKIISNNEYMLWLENFSSKHNNFCDDYWIKPNNNITEEDIQNVKNLSILFEAISNYANDNFIEPIYYSLGEYYYIKFNDTFYQIGIMTWEGTLFFCDKAKKCDKKYIDFSDIRNNKKGQNINLIKNKLMKLSELIVNMSEENVPLKAITATAEKTVQKVLNKRNYK